MSVDLIKMYKPLTNDTATCVFEYMPQILTRMSKLHKLRV